MAHGRADAVVHINRAEASRDYLKNLGYAVQWKDYPMQHSVCEEEIDDLGHIITEWLTT
jgi:phospholipase/carboxylesterase